MKKNSIVFHATMLEVIKDLPREDIIEYLENVFRCVNDEPPVFTNMTTKVLYTSILPVINSDKVKYNIRAERSRLNGLKGGAPLGNQNASKQPKQPNQPKTT